MSSALHCNYVYLALGRSKGPIPFDAQAIVNQVLRMRAIDFTAGVAGASITDVAVTVGEPDHRPRTRARPTRSECRRGSPADDFYPVQTRCRRASTSSFPSSRAPRRTSRTASCSTRSPRSPAPWTTPNNEGIVSCTGGGGAGRSSFRMSD